jgi:hypothetical protein
LNGWGWMIGRSAAKCEVTMASGAIPEQTDSRAARIALVEEHIRLENAHDLEGVLRTFGDTPQYDDEPWGEHFKAQLECVHSMNS